jgi:hypothetical protein
MERGSRTPSVVMMGNGCHAAFKGNGPRLPDALGICDGPIGTSDQPTEASFGVRP